MNESLADLEAALAMNTAQPTSDKQLVLDCLMRKVYILDAQNKPFEAVDVLNSILQQDENHTNAQMYKGIVLAKQGISGNGYNGRLFGTSHTRVETAPSQIDSCAFNPH